MNKLYSPNKNIYDFLKITGTLDVSRAYNDLGYDADNIDSNSNYYIVKSTAQQKRCLLEIKNNVLVHILHNSRSKQEKDKTFNLFLLKNIGKLGIKSLNQSALRDMDALLVPNDLVNIIKSHCEPIKINNEYGVNFIFVKKTNIQINKKITFRHDGFLEFLIKFCIFCEELTINNETAIFELLKHNSKCASDTELIKSNSGCRLRSQIWQLRNSFYLSNKNLLTLIKTHPLLPWHSEDFVPLVLECFDALVRTLKENHPKRYKKVFKNIVSNSLIDNLPQNIVKKSLALKDIDYTFVLNNFDLFYVSKERPDIAKLFKQYLENES